MKLKRLRRFGVDGASLDVSGPSCPLSLSVSPSGWVCAVERTGDSERRGVNPGKVDRGNCSLWRDWGSMAERLRGSFAPTVPTRRPFQYILVESAQFAISIISFKVQRPFLVSLYQSSH